MDKLKVEGDEIKVGLLIGQNDNFIESVPTPTLIHDDDVKGPVIYKTIKDLDEIWISEHSRQVSRLLYGGISVTGIYLSVQSISTLTSDSKNDSILWKILKSIKDGLISDRKYLSTSPSLQTMHVLLYLRSTQQYILKSHDMNGKQYEKFKQTSEVVFPTPNISKSMKCFKLVTPLSIQLELDLTNPEEDLEIMIRNQLESIYSLELKGSSSSCIYLVDGDSSIPSTTIVKNIKIEKSSSTSPIHQIDLLLNQSILKSPLISSSINNNLSKLIISSGLLECKAYVNEKETLETAITYLYQDLIGQFMSRFDILFDQVANNNKSIWRYLKQSATVPFPIILPRRISLGWIDNIDIGDYLDEDEVIEDCKKRIMELFGFDLGGDKEGVEKGEDKDEQKKSQPKWVHSFESTTTELEKSSNRTSNSKSSKKSTITKSIDNTSNNNNNSSSNNNTIIYILVPILMVLIAMLYKLAF